MAATSSPVRQAAVAALQAWAEGHEYAETLVEKQARKRNLSTADRGLLQAILFGVLRHRRLIDHWIGRLRDGKLDAEPRDILRVGLCQLLILGLPGHAAVNETVAVAKASVRPLINAVLRRAAKTKLELLDLAATLPPAVAFSHPDWLFERWHKTFGEADTLALMRHDNEPAETYFRINPLAGDLAAPAAAAVANAPGFFHLEGPLPNDLLAAGKIYIQDPATRHAVDLLDPQPGERVLDACAAPGGKAFLIAARMATSRGLFCTDSNERRLPRLRGNLARLHAPDAVIELHDWTQPPRQEWRGAFDAILLDVPCSNTGVIRRRVDVRWRLAAADVERITGMQGRILRNALPCLKPGGRLVYSTCSIERDENLGVVETLLAEQPEWELRAVRDALPFRDHTDGAFAALIGRKRIAGAVHPGQAAANA